MMKPIYFDNAAAAPVKPEILEYYCRCRTAYFANQEAQHHLAYEARKALGEAEKRLARALALPGRRVVWGESATELFRLLASWLAGKRVTASVLEHPALLSNFQTQTQLSRLRCDRSGALLAETAPERCDAVFIHQVQSELGVVQDVSAIWRYFPDALRFCDAVQAAGKLPVVPDAQIAVISGVKFGAPGGAALLIDPMMPKCDALLDFAAKFRSENYAASRISVASALTLTFAAEKAMERQKETLNRVSALKAELLTAVRALGITPTLPETAPASPWIVNLFLKGYQAAVIVRALSEKGLCVAAGSACAAESGRPSAALRALGLSAQDTYSGLRLSFNAENTSAEIKIFVSELANVLKNY